MNWEQNKFLVSFTVVMILACGGLGFLVSQASSRCGELDEQYQQQVAELQRLQSLPLYPEEGNLSKIEEQKQMAAASVAGLQAQLAQLAFPLESITPEQFQDRLRATVSAIIEKAGAASVKLPDKFYMGFDNYRTSPPKTEAAPALGRELKAIELALNTLIDNKVERIHAIDRKPLPEEDDSAKTAATSSEKAGKAASGDKAPLLTKYPFSIQFTSEQGRFQRALNEIVKNDKQFLIVRPEPIANSNSKPLSKSATQAPLQTGGAGQPNTSQPGASEKAKSGTLSYIVGTEKLLVTLRMEMVIFASSTPK